jgi:hypothetical protein
MDCLFITNENTNIPFVTGHYLEVHPHRITVLCLVMSLLKYTNVVKERVIMDDSHFETISWLSWISVNLLTAIPV